MLESVEDMTFNGITLSEEFAGDSDSPNDSYLVINSVMGRGVVETENTYLSSPGMDGSHPTYSRLRKRTLDVILTLKGDSFEDLRRRVERLNEILYTGNEVVPIQFADEPDRTYYGKVDGREDILEKSRIYQVGLSIVCPDPFKYGEEHTLIFPEDISIITNGGRAEALPVFELTAKEKTTFAMVSIDEEPYNLIGEPADNDVEVVDTRNSVLYENGSTIDEWAPATFDTVDDPNVSNIDGDLGTDGAGIRTSPYGPSGKGQRGGARVKELSTPIQDFELETTFDIISRREEENFRMLIYLHDENMNPIGQLGLKDNSRLYKRRVPLGTAGPHASGYEKGRVLGDQSEHLNDARETTLFYLRMKREGQKFSFYVGEWQNFKHIRTWDGVYRDKGNDYQGRLKYVTLFIGSYRDRPIPARIRMNSVEIFELSSTTVDQTPYILYPGDVVTFDHKDEDILVNGEPRMDLKNFGGTFFPLDKGDNRVVITPEGAFDTEVSFADRYR